MPSHWRCHSSNASSTACSLGAGSTNSSLCTPCGRKGRSPVSPCITRWNQPCSTAAMCRTSPSNVSCELGIDRCESWEGSRPAHFSSRVCRWKRRYEVRTSRSPRAGSGAPRGSSRGATNMFCQPKPWPAHGSLTPQILPRAAARAHARVRVDRRRVCAAGARGVRARAGPSVGHQLEGRAQRRDAADHERLARRAQRRDLAQHSLTRVQQ